MFLLSVKILCRCSVTANHLYLPPCLGKYNNNNNFNNSFTKPRIPPFSKNTIFEEFVHIQLPNFHIFNHSFSQYLASDKEQHLSLNRIAKAVRHDGKVFKSLAESMIAGQVEFAVDQWLDTIGILAIIASSIGLFGFTFTMWSCYKIRTVQLTGLLLHQTHSPAALTPKPSLSFIYNQVPERNITTKY